MINFVDELRKSGIMRPITILLVAGQYLIPASV